jgi:hypothetical protein
MAVIFEFYWLVIGVLFLLSMIAYDNKHVVTVPLYLCIIGFTVLAFTHSIDSDGVFHGNLSSLPDMLSVKLVSIGLAAYIAAGCAVTFVNYIVYCWRVKENYTNVIERTCTSQQLQKIRDNDDSYWSTVDDESMMYVLKLRAVRDNIGDIFNSESEVVAYMRMRDDTAITQSVLGPFEYAQKCKDALESILPPKFKYVKEMIIWSAIIWPITLAWLIAYRFVRQVLERLISWQRAIFEYFGSLAFGKL